MGIIWGFVAVIFSLCNVFLLLDCIIVCIVFFQLCFHSMLFLSLHLLIFVHNWGQKNPRLIEFSVSDKYDLHLACFTS